MSHQSLFDAAIGTPPPSTLDLDRFIARQRRSHAWRRAAAVGGGVGVAAAVVAGYAAVGLPLGAGAPIATTPALQPGASASSPPTPPPYTPPADVPAFDAAFTARVSPAARAAVRAVRPDVTLSSNYPGRPALKFYSNRAEVAPPTVPSSYYASADVSDAEDGGGQLGILIGYESESELVEAPNGSGYVSGPNLDFDACPDPGSDSELASCETSTGPDGEQITATTMYFVDGEAVDAYAAGAGVHYSVFVARTDGTEIIMTARNFDRNGKPAKGARGGRDLPPFTHDQLTRIALTPDLSFYG
jgi:hypothetical protein